MSEENNEEVVDFIKKFSKNGVKAFLAEVGYDLVNTDDNTEAMQQSLEIFGVFLLSGFLKAISVENP